MYEQEIRTYCRSARGQLRCGREQRQKFERYDKAGVQDYLQEKPDASWAEIEQALGVPADAVELYMSTLPEGTAEHWISARRLRFRLGIAATCLVVALLIGCLAFFSITDGILVFESKETVIYLDDDVPFPTAEPIV